MATGDGWEKTALVITKVKMEIAQGTSYAAFDYTAVLSGSKSQCLLVLCHANASQCDEVLDRLKLHFIFEKTFGLSICKLNKQKRASEVLRH